jgi:hypothetical protein
MAKSYRTREAAGYLDVSKSWLDKQAAKGTGPAYRKVGRRRIYDQPDLDNFKRATRVEPKSCSTSIEDQEREGSPGR